jgi:autotransporter-associated beta strand protein
VPTQQNRETFTNLIVNPPVGTGQFIMRQNMAITGLAEARNGILGVASGHTGNIQALQVSGNAIVRVAGSTGDSVMNVGAGGITAAGGNFQIKFNTNEFSAQLNLAGNYTATGNVAFTNANYAGAATNSLNLVGTSHDFTIAAGTTTSMATDIGGTGALVKLGDGNLHLLASCKAAHTGDTQISSGTLILDGSVETSPIAVAAGATVAGTGTVLSALSVAANAQIAPGNATTPVGNLTVQTGTLAAGSRYLADITAAATNDQITSAGGFTLDGTIQVTLTGHNPVAGETFTLFNGSIAGTPSFDFTAAPLTGGLTWDTSQFTTNGSIRVSAGAGAYDAWASDRGLIGPAAAKTADPDGDGVSNLMEFATNADPNAAGSLARVFGSVRTVSGQPVFTFTVATRKNSTFAANGSTQTASTDGVNYTIGASATLAPWANTQTVSQLAPADASAVQATLSLPSLDADWEWHTFALPAPLANLPKQFVRLQVE